MAKLVNLIPNNKPTQNEALEDMDVKLPQTVEKFLDRVIRAIKSYNLPPKKEQAVIARVVDALNVSPSQLSIAVQKLKKYKVVGNQKDKNIAEALTKNNVDDVNFSADELEFLMALINNMGDGQHPWADSKTIGLFKIDYVKKLLAKGKGKIPSKYNSVVKNVNSKLQ